VKQRIDNIQFSLKQKKGSVTITSSGVARGGDMGECPPLSEIKVRVSMVRARVWSEG